MATHACLRSPLPHVCHATGEPLDPSGQFHKGIKFYQHCQLNPWEGKTAREAVAASALVQGRPQFSAHDCKIPWWAFNAY